MITRASQRATKSTIITTIASDSVLYNLQSTSDQATHKATQTPKTPSKRHFKATLQATQSASLQVATPKTKKPATTNASKTTFQTTQSTAKQTPNIAHSANFLPSLSCVALGNLFARVSRIYRIDVSNDQARITPSLFAKDLSKIYQEPRLTSLPKFIAKMLGDILPCIASKKQSHSVLALDTRGHIFAIMALSCFFTPPPFTHKLR